MDKNQKTSFLIKVDYRENNSIQGSIHWLEENKVTRYKSMIELITLIGKTVPNLESLDWDNNEKVLNVEEALTNK